MARLLELVFSLVSVFFVLYIPGTCVFFQEPSRSPRWTSGSPRMLLVLVHEFESRRGEILNLFAKIKKDELLRAPINSVGGHRSTPADGGRKS